MMIGIPNQYALCMQNDDSILGIVGPDYVPLQNKDAFEWFQPFLDTESVTLETAGSLKVGTAQPRTLNPEKVEHPIRFYPNGCSVILSLSFLQYKRSFF